MNRVIAFLAVIATFCALPPQAVAGVGANDFASYSWTRIYGDNPAGWVGRAGLQAVELRNHLYVMGGRTPNPSQSDPFASVLWNDVWESGDLGRSWRQVTARAGWQARGYFQAVTKGDAMYVLGGQNLKAGPPPVCPPDVFSCSDFFNDVWMSTDGVGWEEMPEVGERWAPRAGLSAIEFKGWIYVLGGSQGDDVAIGGAGRVLYNDVWRSRDGRRWERMTANAEWAPRAGAAVVEKNGFLYVLGGEDGFLCTPGPFGLECPYFNDVWRSRDGASWELVTMSAGWSPRPGHQCQVLLDTIVCFGGFGWPAVADPTRPPGPGNPLVANHPRDVWVSRDGRQWEKLPHPPWNAATAANVKYDFDSLVVTGGPGGLRPSIFTFGGDREISFINPDPGAVDDDVWRFSPR
jgi:hypothetical protein